MNINEDMHDLGTMGGLAYAPSDDLVASLVSKTKRARAARQSSATIVGTVGALALGLAAAQAYSAAKDDPAFRDRNGINNKDSLTPIELYRAKFGNDNPTRSYDAAVDLSSIIDKLKAAAASGDPTLGSTTPQVPEAPAVPANSGATTTTPTKTAPANPHAQCEAEHPDKPYKYYDCATSQWVIKPGWYNDPATSQYFECAAQPAYTGYTYNCSTGSYAPNAGYFLFGNGSVYKAITWVDTATGVSSLGNWSGTGNWGGWDQKAIQVDSGSKNYREYVYMGGTATWSGSTCTGSEAVKYGTTMRASCLPESKVAATGLKYKMADGLAWVLKNQSLVWHPCLNVFADPANPPAGWSWTGAEWVEDP